MTKKEIENEGIKPKKCDCGHYEIPLKIFQFKGKRVCVSCYMQEIENFNRNNKMWSVRK